MGLTSDKERLAGPEAAFDTVHADTLRFFPELVRRLGGDPEQLAAEVDLDPACLSNGGPCGYRSLANLMEHAAVRLGCPDFGLRLAAEQGGGSVFGALGVVMRNSKTFGEGLAYVVDHCHAHSLAARVRLVPDRDARTVFVRHDILLDPLPITRQVMEQFLLLAHLNAVESSDGKARVRRVLFRFQPQSSKRTYQRYFGCDAQFDQPADGVVFSEADLRCPTADPDPQVHAKATRFIETQFPPSKPPVRAQVRALILQWIESAECTKERVAAELRIHPRTLHRRLIAEGTSFEQVKDAVRRDVALGCLRASALSVQRIAERVGYAEHSVLTRSCSRWFGASPREVRRRVAASDVRSLSEFFMSDVRKCRDRLTPAGLSRSDRDLNTEANDHECDCQRPDQHPRPRDDS
jgi:AraC-like DNA-binding protein